MVCRHASASKKYSPERSDWAAEGFNYAGLLGFNDFKASTGWLSRFKAQRGIVGKVLSGESAAADGEAASAWMSDNAGSILEQYGPSDIYNADEIALSYEMLPSMTLYLKGQRCHGGKHSKKRVTVLLWAYMEGSNKRPPLVIGKSAKPRCSKGNRRLPVKYVANTKAWKKCAILTEWVVAFDRAAKCVHYWTTAQPIVWPTLF